MEWVAHLHSDHTRELSNVGTFLGALRTRFEDVSRIRRAEGEVLGIKQRGRLAAEYVREFRRVASKLWTWPERLLVHQFRAGLDRDLRQACVYRGIPEKLQAWFQIVTDLDTGLQEFRPRSDIQQGPRRNPERPRPIGPASAPPGGLPRPTFCCFRCNLPGHRAAECPEPLPKGRVEMGEKSTPKRIPERSRAAKQHIESPMSRGERSNTGEGTSAGRPPLIIYDEDVKTSEDPMVSEPIHPFILPITITSTYSGHRRQYNALLDTGCTRCLISEHIVRQTGIRVRPLHTPV